MAQTRHKDPGDVQFSSESKNYCWRLKCTMFCFGPPGRFSLRGVSFDRVLFVSGLLESFPTAVRSMYKIVTVKSILIKYHSLLPSSSSWRRCECWCLGWLWWGPAVAQLAGHAVRALLPPEIFMILMSICKSTMMMTHYSQDLHDPFEH